MNTPVKQENDYRALSVLAIAMIMGILSFSIVAIVVHYINGHFVEERKLMNLFLMIVLLLGTIVIIAARTIYKKRVLSIKEGQGTDKEKMDSFRAMTVTHMALCEMPALISIICFMVFGNFLFFLVVLIALAEMTNKFPFKRSVDKVITPRF